MGQPGIAQGDGRWYLITSYGDLVVRVHPDMAVGESATGELSFDPTCAQLTLDIEDDGGLVLKAVDDHELEPTGGPRCRKAHLARHRRAEVHLPHNIIRIDTDFVNLAPTDDSVAILTVRPMGASTKPSFEPLPEGLPVEPLDPGLEARPPQRATSRSAHRDDNPTPDSPPVEPMHGIPLPLRKPPPEPDGQTASDRPADPQTERLEQPARIQHPEQIEQPEQIHTEQNQQPQQIQQIETVERTGTRRQRVLSPRMAGLIGLAAVSFALLLYVALGEDPVTAPPPATVDAGPASPAEPAAAPSASPTPSLPLSLPASEAPPVTKPDDGDQMADRLFEPLPEPESVAEPVAQPVAQPDIELIELPLAERRSIPPTEPTIAQTLGANKTAAGAAKIDSLPDATVAEEPEKIDTKPDATVAIEPTATDRRADAAVGVKAAEVSERPQAQDPEQARRRTLRAADVALEQGRLTTPPEASAYTLYNKVLALDPDSPEARSGLQSVRQGLINRALAQLASDALDDARTSLQAAADTGANPMLVADLLREVDYRQQLINTQGGARQSP